MKLLITLGALIASMNAMASDVKSVYLVSHGEVTQVRLARPNCPRGAMCSPRAEATVTVTLDGCLDQLGPVTASVGGDPKNIYIELTAVGIRNKRSAQVKCVAPATAEVTVGLPTGGFVAPKLENVELQLLTRDLNQN